MKPKSDSLFHFTSKFDYLTNILSHGLQPRICHEDISFLHGKSRLLSVPMVCFCDIPISRLTDHTDFYGFYGIGFTRQWAEKNEIHPVSYTSKSSPLAEASRFLLRKFKKMSSTGGGLRRIDQDFQQDLIEYTQKIKRLMAFSKPYRGKQEKRSIKQLVPKNFFEENEWRFVPNDYVFNDLSENPEKIVTQNNRHAANALTFEPRDITYIFVKSENEIDKIFDVVMKTFKPKYDNSTVKKLLTKITCLDLIEKDL